MRRLLILLLAIGGLAPQSRVSAQTLDIAGTRLTVNGTPKFLVFISYFDGMHRAAGGADALADDFAYFRRHLDGIRVLVNWCGDPCRVKGQAGAADTLFDQYGVIRAEAWARFRTLLDAAKAHGLLVDVTFTRDTFMPGTAPDPEHYAIGINAVIARLEQDSPGTYRNVFFDVQNEYPIHGLSDADVDTIVTKARAARSSVIVTGSVTQRTATEAADIARNRHFSVVAFHDGREATPAKHWFELARMLGDVGPLSQTGLPIVYDEPTAYCAPGSHEPCSAGNYDDSELAHFRDAAKNAKQAGIALWTFHTREGFNLSAGSYVSRASQAEKDVIAAIRDAVRGQDASALRSVSTEFSSDPSSDRRSR